MAQPPLFPKFFSYLFFFVYFDKLITMQQIGGNSQPFQASGYTSLTGSQASPSTGIQDSVRANPSEQKAYLERLMETSSKLFKSWGGISGRPRPSKPPYSQPKVPIKPPVVGLTVAPSPPVAGLTVPNPPVAGLSVPVSPPKVGLVAGPSAPINGIAPLAPQIGLIAPPTNT